jgi:hypothetical protein
VPFSKFFMFSLVSFPVEDMPRDSTVFDLSNCNVDDAAADQLAVLLEGYGSPVTHVCLEKNHIGDAGVEKLLGAVKAKQVRHLKMERWGWFLGFPTTCVCVCLCVCWAHDMYIYIYIYMPCPPPPTCRFDSRLCAFRVFASDALCHPSSLSSFDVQMCSLSYL